MGLFTEYAQNYLKLLKIYLRNKVTPTGEKKVSAFFLP